MYKKMLLIIGYVFLLQSCCFTGDCYEPSYEPTYLQSNYKPVVLKRDLFESTIQLITPKTNIENSGKIYIKENLLFINEKNNGFHIFDNTDKKNPEKINYINIPGATDMAIRGNIIYINQATDLVAIEYDQNNTLFKVVKRIKNVFPELISPDGYIVYDLRENEIVVDWKLKK
jgi:hypothetical protein